MADPRPRPGRDPEPEHLAPPRGLRDREPRRRPRRRDHRADAVAGAVGRTRRPRRRLRHRLPPPAVRRHGRARSTGVEPHGDLAAIARRRVRRLPNVSVLHGSAEALPLPDGSVDVVHARWAYFFGPGCEPGLAELDRVVRPGSRAFVIDNDPTRSTFGAWFRRGYPDVDHVEAARSGPSWGGTGTPSTWPGPSTRARTSSPSYASSSPPTWPRRSSPATRARRSTTRSTCGRGAGETALPGTALSQQMLANYRPGALSHVIAEPLRGSSADRPSLRSAGWSGVRRGRGAASGPCRRTACGRARGAGSGPARRRPAPAADAPR